MMSLWEHTWLFNADTIIIGSGIVGLSCAAAILEEQPTHKVLILERGLVPSGASTKNAGFFSFGTFFEVLKDIDALGEKEAVKHIKVLHESLLRFKNRVGAENLDLKQYGGYDIFTEDMLPKLEKLKYVNDLLRPIFKEDVFSITNERIEEFGFNKNIVKALVYNKFEGQFDSGKGILRFQNYVQKLGARIVSGADVTGWEKDSQKNVIVKVKNPAAEGKVQEFRCQNLVLCTESFSIDVLKGLDIYPFRGQVLVTSPIPDLKMKGTFIYHDAYFYMRDYYGRLLIGGGAIPYWDEESVSELKNTNKITDSIEKLLREVILPKTEFKIDYKWAGIMCLGKESSEPIVKELEENVFCAIRMGEAGVARCSLAADEIKKQVLAKQRPKPKL